MPRLTAITVEVSGRLDRAYAEEFVGVRCHLDGLHDAVGHVQYDGMIGLPYAVTKIPGSPFACVRPTHTPLGS